MVYSKIGNSNSVAFGGSEQAPPTCAAVVPAEAAPALGAAVGAPDAAAPDASTTRCKPGLFGDAPGAAAPGEALDMADDAAGPSPGAPGSLPAIMLPPPVVYWSWTVLSCMPSDCCFNNLCTMPSDTYSTGFSRAPFPYLAASRVHSTLLCLLYTSPSPRD